MLSDLIILKECAHVWAIAIFAEPLASKVFDIFFCCCRRKAAGIRYVWGWWAEAELL